jgi:hypothetical protein
MVACLSFLLEHERLGRIRDLYSYLFLKERDYDIKKYSLHKSPLPKIFLHAQYMLLIFF